MSPRPPRSPACGMPVVVRQRKPKPSPSPARIWGAAGRCTGWLRHCTPTGTKGRSKFTWANGVLSGDSKRRSLAGHHPKMPTSVVLRSSRIARAGKTTAAAALSANRPPLTAALLWRRSGRNRPLTSVADWYYYLGVQRQRVRIVTGSSRDMAKRSAMPRTRYPARHLPAGAQPQVSGSATAWRDRSAARNALAGPKAQERPHRFTG
jgi:hypothetical protein